MAQLWTAGALAGNWGWPCGLAIDACSVSRNQEDAVDTSRRSVLAGAMIPLIEINVAEANDATQPVEADFGVGVYLAADSSEKDAQWRS
jgi:hypothetical protein